MVRSYGMFEVLKKHPAEFVAEIASGAIAGLVAGFLQWAAMSWMYSDPWTLGESIVAGLIFGLAISFGIIAGTIAGVNGSSKLSVLLNRDRQGASIQ